MRLQTYFEWSTNISLLLLFYLGIILSGNEISQILLSLILSYVGGHRNRPRWIAWGVVFCALSCFILASPHFIYGAGESALQLTKEFISSQEAEAEASILSSHNLTSIVKSTNRLCLDTFSPKECHDIISVVPLVLIFMSQFVLGIGNTLYYSLGQTYLDDNTKKTNTPLMLAYASSLRTFGPVVGFALGLEPYGDMDEIENKRLESLQVTSLLRFTLTRSKPR